MLVLGALAALGAIGVVLLVIGLAAEEEPVLPERAIPVPVVLEDPRPFLGREITVTGQVDMLTDKALTLGDEDLIVVGNGRERPGFETSGVAVGDVVYVTGQLRRLSADEVTDLLPRTSLLPSAFQGFDREPVLMADAVIPAR